MAIEKRMAWGCKGIRGREGVCVILDRHVTTNTRVIAI
jgi:hypothetical protein